MGILRRGQGAYLRRQGRYCAGRGTSILEQSAMGEAPDRWGVCGFRLAAGGVGKAFLLITRGDHRYIGKKALNVMVASRRSQVTCFPFHIFPPGSRPNRWFALSCVPTRPPCEPAGTGFTPGPAWRGRNTSELIGTPRISRHQGRCLIRFITHRREDKLRDRSGIQGLLNGPQRP